MTSQLYTLLLLFFLISCTEKYQGEKETLSDVSLPVVDYSGRVIDRDGTTLAGVKVTLRYHKEHTYTDLNGDFLLLDIDAKNDMVLLEKEGYYDMVLSYSGLDDTAPVFKMKKKSQESVRLLFTGDLSFARRFMDPKSPDRTVRLIENDVKNSTLKVTALQESGQALINPLKPLFHSVDFPTVNFESIATQAQNTLDEIHPKKDFAYYTNTDSLPLLKDLHINFVTLGNNHVYDYDSAGLRDTLDALDKNKINYSGAGMSVEEAFIPYRTTIKGKAFSFWGATSIRGDKHSLLYVAHTNGEGKKGEAVEADPFATQGGAADAHNRKRVAKLLGREKEADHFTVYQFHGGIEYTYAPNSVALKLIKSGVESGASLVVSHHPHTAQGYGMIEGVFVAYGLGNFIFDQDRLDTMFSHILVCDVENKKVTGAMGYPIYIENYVPKLLTGDVANRFIRHISEASRNGSRLLETPLESDFMVFPYQYREYMILDGNYSTQTKVVEKEVVIGSEGQGVVDLRHMVSSEYSLSSIEQGDGLTMTLGRDLLWFGSFEDSDVDQEYYENGIWNFSSAIATSKVAYQGRASAHFKRDASQPESALLYFGRRIRTIGDARDEPNKDLTFLGYFKGDNSRPFNIETHYFGSIGEESFGVTELYRSQGGSFDWKQISQPIVMPKDEVESADYQVFLAKNARALKFTIRMQDTHTKDAHLYVDDLAIINWEESYEGNQTIGLSSPHAREFLRVKGQPGHYKIRLVFQRYLPTT